MKQNSSSRRVNEQARQVIAETLMFEFSDPRLSLITITGCEVSFDRAVCNVYYTTTPDRYEEAQEALERAGGRIRSLLAKTLSWRTSPELRFFLDKTVDEAEKIARALEHERRRSGDDVAESSDESDNLAAEE
ncbi:MAG: 30S ribosome-binding factor RbfA [Eggerthellaceae bacterium]|nr:30S ribosome-binding factor RbfA [Eggerthellaceae bacterium]